nr:hypothetical protein [uncultured Halomonas sp.]
MVEWINHEQVVAAKSSKAPGWCEATRHALGWCAYHFFKAHGVAYNAMMSCRIFWKIKIIFNEINCLFKEKVLPGIFGLSFALNRWKATVVGN